MRWDPVPGLVSIIDPWVLWKPAWNRYRLVETFNTVSTSRYRFQCLTQTRSFLTLVNPMRSDFGATIDRRSMCTLTNYARVRVSRNTPRCSEGRPRSIWQRLVAGGSHQHRQLSTIKLWFVDVLIEPDLGASRDRQWVKDCGGWESFMLQTSEASSFLLLPHREDFVMVTISFYIFPVANSSTIMWCNWFLIFLFLIIYVMNLYIREYIYLIQL